MGILRADNITGLGGRTAMKGSVFFSGYVDGTSADWLQIHDNLADFNVGTGDFTFECWVKAAASSGGYAGIFGMYDYDNAGLLIQLDNQGRVRLVNPGAIDQTGSTVLYGTGSTMGDWHHYAVARSGTTIKAFINGVQEISHTYSNGIDFSNGGSAVIGVTDRSDYPGDYDLKGYISNLRLIKGTALYTTAFTPPTEELTAVDGTVLLCCQDNDDPTAEATGRHEIVGFRKCYQGKRYSNIATNGDLETGDTTGWTNNTGSGTFEISTDSHSGSYSLHCVSDGNGDGVSYAVSLNTTLRYKISAYIKVLGPAGTSAKAKMKIGNGFGGNENYESQTISTFNRWEYVEWIGLASYATTTVSFVESSANAVNDFLVDDLRVELWYPEEGENILANPNFLTDATGWSFTTTPSGEYTISSNRLNLADNSRTNDALATQQLYNASMAEGRYKVTIDYVLTSADFDIGIGNNRIFGVSGGGSIPPGEGNSASVTYEIEAGNANSSLRLVGNQHCVGYFNNITCSRVPEPKKNNPVPTVGVDNGTTFVDNTRFDTLSYMVPPKGTTAQSNRGRGTFSGGYTSPSNANLNSIDYVQIQSLGNSIDFGDLTQARYGGGSGASSTRGLQMGGRVSSTKVKTIDYITFATTSNATTFGDLTVINAYVQGASNNTRALNMGGGTPAYTSLINYVTIASTGDGQEFGDLTDARGGAPAVASPTRACCVSGHDGSSYVTVIDYVEIASQGVDASTFGDVSSAFAYGAGLSSNTRGIVGGGTRGSGEINDIVYITIASKGDATDFGDLYKAREHTSATSNSIRGVFGGGVTPTYYNNIQYVTISTTGNSVDFGDFIVDARKAYSMTTSDSHGGLS